MPKAMLYYFPGNRKAPFGHVAIGVAPHKDFAPAGYLTFGIGEGKATSPIAIKTKSKGDAYQSEYLPDFGIENRLYQGAIMIDLPDSSQDAYINALRQFSNLDRSSYCIFSKNCANAVIGFMKTIGCIPENEKFYGPVRPITIAKRACEVALETLEKKRTKIKDGSTPLLLILELLRNDIARLHEQMKLERINGMQLTNHARNKQQLQMLNSILSQGEECARTTEGFDQFHRDLMHARNLPGKTGSHISECLYYFPTALLSDLYIRELAHSIRDDVHFHKMQRKVILQDHKLNATESVQKLLENEIQSLNAQINKNEKTFRGIFKNPEKMRDKIEKLEVASFLLSTNPVDYASNLRYLTKLTQDRSMQGKTADNLRQCLEHFPYDKLPQIEEMRKFLVKLDFLLLPKEMPKKSFMLFGTPAAPREIMKIRALVPMDDKIDHLSDREVYERFTRIDAMLQTGSNKGTRDHKLQDFYHDANLLVREITTPGTEPNTPKSSNDNSFSGPLRRSSR